MPNRFPEFTNPKDVVAFMNAPTHYSCVFRATQEFPIALAPHPLPGWKNSRHGDTAVSYINVEMERAATGR